MSEELPTRFAAPAQGPWSRLPARSQLLAEVGEELRVLVVGGMPVGVLVAGVGGRLGMLLLRVTSPDSVRGVESDDGFTIGQFTLFGTYNLLLIGAAVGFIGAAAYRVVAPRLIGPTWFRRVTTGLASAAVVGSLLLHEDGVDFTLLTPTWLAIGLFVVLPGLFGAVIGPAVDSVAKPESWTAGGRLRSWGLPVLLVVCFPPTLVLVGLGAAILTCWVPLRDTVLQQVRASSQYTFVVRCLWLFVAMAGLFALGADISVIA